MKYWVVSFVLFFCTLQTFGQDEYFVYLQTENNQPFYIRIDKAVYSSSATGYLILPRINNNGNIPITIGFPRNAFPEQLFSLPATGKDAGYLVKDYGEKGWGLYNLQTLATIMNNNPPIKKNVELSGTKKTDDFSLLLSNAVNDTAVLYAVVKPPKQVVPAEAKKDSAVAITTPNNVLGKDSAAIKDTSLIVSNIQLQPVKENNKPKPDTVKKVIADTAALAKTVAPEPQKQNTAQKDSSLIVSNISLEGVKEVAKPSADSVAKKPIADSAAIVKTVPPATQPQNTIVKDSPVVKTKQPVKQGRGDSITIINGKNTDTVAKNKERKDTIIIMSGSKPPVTDVAKGKERKDSIIMMNGTALNDNKANGKNNNTANDSKVTPAAIPKKDSVAEKTQKPETEIPKTAITELPVKKAAAHISKAAEFRTDTSYVAIFIDETGDDNADTIRISVPFREPAEVIVKNEDNKPVTAVNKPTDTAVNSKATKDSAAIAKTVKDTAKQNTTPVQSPIVPVKKDSAVAIAANTAKPNKPAMANSDCKEEATDSDIDKLRVKMLLVNTDEDHIALARRLFKVKCFSVKQVRALTELFKTDEGRYKWFDAVYPYVSDGNNFSSLSEFLKNDYYLNRFKAMLRN